MYNEPHDAHVAAATKVFRACGFTLAAMEFPRPAEALRRLKRFNGLADDAKVPFTWNFFANRWCLDNWEQSYPEIKGA